MHRLAVFVCCSLVGFSQQTTSKPDEGSGPRQSVLLPHATDIDAERGHLRTQAKLVLDSEVARQKAEDCTDLKNTYESNVCLAKEIAVTGQNLKAYEGTIRELLGPKLSFPGPSQMRGPSGPVLTPQENVAEFDRMEQFWHSYLQTASKVAFHQFGGGTGAPPFEMVTHLQLVRSHIFELSNIYELVLRY